MTTIVACRERWRRRCRQLAGEKIVKSMEHTGNKHSTTLSIQMCPVLRANVDAYVETRVRKQAAWSYLHPVQNCRSGQVAVQ